MRTIIFSISVLLLKNDKLSAGFLFHHWDYNASGPDQGLKTQVFHKIVIKSSIFEKLGVSRGRFLGCHGDGSFDTR